MGLDRENGVYCHAEHFGVCVGIAISHVLHFGQGDVAAVGIAEDENYSKKLSAINKAGHVIVHLTLGHTTDEKSFSHIERTKL